MTAFTWDRIMSLHRRACGCATYDDWWALAARLDCPADARDQFWRTARAALAADMTAKEAFPLVGQLPPEVRMAFDPRGVGPEE